MKAVKPLKDGRYTAQCRQETFLAAVAAGHSRAFPIADVIVSGGWARFYRGGEEVWSCNPSYAAVHFIITKV
ncbi:hypothetical protein DBB29_00785 [Pandoraea cepalis]|uniref:Uncharacterized protein n=1 Tax=Pandoraea cepalis TaxID=2508294 RepID=A0AAW7MHA3_9BURK|nr:hypothetical protein [Pandoraea cepalis]MDN4572018.1 hypothetical protein [Pandoraea cepalis]MDN4576669.1 hypothetical protein [Pandoraea cepalis]